MTSSKLFATLVLTATAVSTLTAETHCPGNAASVPLQIVNRHQMIVSVSVHHAGPFNFLLDPTLAATLKLATSGTAEVASAGVSASASFAQVELIEAGSRSAANQKVLVYNLKNLQASGLDIRGVLAEAINYALSQWREMNVFCSDGAVAIDNNASEREMKRVVLHRKNSLFVANPRGGRTAAILATLTSTCRRQQ